MALNRPESLTPERAQWFFDNQRFGEDIAKHMTFDEEAYVLDLFIESTVGSSTFTSILYAIAKGKL